MEADVDAHFYQLIRTVIVLLSSYVCSPTLTMPVTGARYRGRIWYSKILLRNHLENKGHIISKITYSQTGFTPDFNLLIRSPNKDQFSSDPMVVLLSRFYVFITLYLGLSTFKMTSGLTALWPWPCNPIVLEGYGVSPRRLTWLEATGNFFVFFHILKGISSSLASVEVFFFFCRT